ncbi:MAG: hypothetical protein ABUL48_03545 [Pseudorhodoplanes sp.]
MTSLARSHPTRIAKILGPLLLGLWLWPFGPYVKGNDTGGIISWDESMTKEEALSLAGGHCNRWDKFAVITSVHPWPGDYIGFACRRQDRWGPAPR